MKKPWAIVCIVVGLLVVLGPGKDLVIRSAVIVAAKAVAGVDVKMGYFSLSLMGQSVKIRDVRVYNPEGFPTQEVMVDIPGIDVQLDTFAFLKNTLHVKYMRLDLREARVIKNQNGKLNVNSLKFAEKKDGGRKSGLVVKEKSPREMAMKFDLVSLNIGKVIMEDYTGKGDGLKVSVYDVNLKEKEFRNMTSATQLASVVMLTAMTPAGVQGAFSLGAKVLGGAVGSASHTVGGVLKTIKNRLGD
ncbi:MAG: hypothetical protein HQL21_03485 [Candidatus Omnitrophica bacterium]|nr:hypothetical protein [Candidatus Omnitrophota bacterium]